MKGSGIDFAGKYATQISTSKHFYDITAHRFIRENAQDMGMRYVDGLSADMEDLLSEKGREEAEKFYVENILGGKEPELTTVEDVLYKYPASNPGTFVEAADEIAQAVAELKEKKAAKSAG